MQEYSFYYRDSISLKDIFPKAYGFSLLYPDENIIIKDGVMRLKNPDTFEPSSIHNIVRVYPNKYDYFKIEVKIRCWKEGRFRLKEITKNTWIKTNKFFKFLHRVINKIHPLPYNTHLVTANNVSYFSHNNHLLRRENGVTTVVGKLPRITQSVYFEFLPIGTEAFLRTGGLIYRSNKGMRQWTLIYEGKRGIKNSMVWIEKEQALLFSEYTPGLDLCRHHLYKYYVTSGETKTILTFYTPNEHAKDGANPYCRHIHVLMRDPYSNDIYMGVGDSDDESAIYRSVDNGNSFSLIGSGDQSWRTLSFLFTEDCIYWNTDSPDPQFLSCINRTQLNDSPLQTKDVKHWPLFNSASWNTTYDQRNGLVIMSASREGALYDLKNRVYGIRIGDDAPVVYSLFEDQSLGKEPTTKWQQLFVLGIDNEGCYWFYDTHRHYYRRFVLCKTEEDRQID